MFKRFLKNDLREENENPVFSRIDLDHFVNKSESGSIIHEMDMEQSVKLFRNALDFSKIKLREVMIPRTEIETLEINASIDELKQKFIDTGVFKDTFL